MAIVHTPSFNAQLPVVLDEEAEEIVQVIVYHFKNQLLMLRQGTSVCLYCVVCGD